ncbi:MAG: HAMP domain-containing histidine kinase [Elusimicrobia bacterium]|nr:HAMP domain-containing histidine kinase [Elusimicrobiota bacterium]
MPEGTPVEPTIVAVLSAVEPVARRRGVSVQVEADLRLAAAVEAETLRSILEQLLTRAVSSTRRGGWVRVCAQPERAEALVSVKDSGGAFVDRKFRERVASLIRTAGGRSWSHGELERGSTFYFGVPRYKVH